MLFEDARGVFFCFRKRTYGNYSIFSLDIMPRPSTTGGQVVPGPPGCFSVLPSCSIPDPITCSSFFGQRVLFWPKGSFLVTPSFQ